MYWKNWAKKESSPQKTRNSTLQNTTDMSNAMAGATVQKYLPIFTDSHMSG